MDMHITVRELQEGDIEELSRIESESFSMPWSAQDFRELLSRPYCYYLVAEMKKRVVGCCGFTDICNEGNIDNVVVDAAWRGKGIGQAMLRELLARGEERGVEAFTLEVRVSNGAAIHIYEKLGFCSAGIRPGFYERPVEDAVIMWRYPEKRPE